jgi:hypothetical protein
VAAPRKQPTAFDEYPDRRDFAPADFCDHLASDAGKTTLTEKLLLFGGAIQLAGEVKARGERRRVRSDCMAVERERGISVSSAVMSFEHEGLAFNLLDTPGHQDFSQSFRPRERAVQGTGASRSLNQRQLRSHQGRGRDAGRLPQAIERPFRTLGEQQVAHGQPCNR